MRVSSPACWAPLGDPPAPRLQAPVCSSSPACPPLCSVLGAPPRFFLLGKPSLLLFSLFLFLFCGWGLFSGSGNLGCLLRLKLGD